MPNTKALEILATHGVQCTVPELMELIYDDNAVLKLKFCLEAIEQALSPLEQSENKEEWVSVETPPIYEGTYLVYYNEIEFIATTNFYPGLGFNNIRDVKVTHWQPLPKPPCKH